MACLRIGGGVGNKCCWLVDGSNGKGKNYGRGRGGEDNYP